MGATNPSPQPVVLDAAAVQRLLPHRYPMLLIDRVEGLIPGESAVGIKSVSQNEPFFPGHFPNHPIMPGVLIIEAMAQTAGVVVVCDLPQVAGKRNLVYFMSIESARFRRPVVPGDRLQIRVHKDRQRGNVWKFRGGAFSDDQLCAEAEFTAMLVQEDAPP